MTRLIEPGRVLGNRFCLERLLGFGSMGEVWEASDNDLDGRAAVKVLRTEFLQEREWRARFRREASIAQTIDSPYVARMLAAGTSLSARRPWIAFELVTGEPLDAYLRRVPRPQFQDVVWIVSDLLRGLDAVHSVAVNGARIVHRDIKPANLIMEAERRRLRLLDFGIAKVSREGVQTSGLTHIDEGLGTPAFMSPEQRADAKSVDARSDIYGAGSVAFLLLTGQPTWTRAEPFTSRSLAAASGVTWPASMQGWIDQMLAEVPHDRFASARAALHAWAVATEAMTNHVAERAPRSTIEATSKTDLTPPSRGR